MNQWCKCPAAGFCPRHQFEKDEALFQLCKGNGNASDCGYKYWVAMETGQIRNPKTGLKIAPQANPILTREGFCNKSIGLGSTVSRVVTKLTGIKPCSGCNGRAAILNHWFPGAISPVEPIEFSEVRRNLMMHVWPVKEFGVWQWNCDQILKRAELFNGRRLISIATGGGKDVRSQAVDSPDAVKEYLRDFTDDFVVVNNDKRLQEVATFTNMLEQLESIDPNEVTFYCHAKGVRHKFQADSNHAVLRWSEAMYHTCLDYWPMVEEQLRTKAMTGSFKLHHGQKKLGNRWFYSGTFYWFRHQDVFRRNWRYIDKKFIGVELWPGKMFSAEETGCLFQDGVGDLYSSNYWDSTIQPAYDQWLLDNRSHLTTDYPKPVKREGPPVTLCTAVWGDYWARFGRSYIAAIERMNPPPREVVIVSKEPLEVSAWIKQYRPQSDTPMGDWYNEAVEHATNEWVVCLGVDDTFLIDGLDGLALEGEAVAIGGIEHGAPWLPDESGYRDILTIPHNPMRGGVIFRRDTFLRFPWRRMRWSDWAQWLEFNHAGVDVRFDLRPRFHHRRHAGANSAVGDPVADEALAQLKNSLSESIMVTS